MSIFAETIARIRRAHKKLGTLELSRLSGVPYTTLRDVAKREFNSSAVETLEKLALAVEGLPATPDGGQGEEAA